MFDRPPASTLMSYSTDYPTTNSLQVKSAIEHKNEVSINCNHNSENQKVVFLKKIEENEQKSVINEFKQTTLTEDEKLTSGPSTSRRFPVQSASFLLDPMVRSCSVGKYNYLPDKNETLKVPERTPVSADYPVYRVTKYT